MAGCEVRREEVDVLVTQWHFFSRVFARFAAFQLVSAVYCVAKQASQPRCAIDSD